MTSKGSQQAGFFFSTNQFEVLHARRLEDLQVWDFVITFCWKWLQVHDLTVFSPAYRDFGPQVFSHWKKNSNKFYLHSGKLTWKMDPLKMYFLLKKGDNSELLLLMEEIPNNHLGCMKPCQ